MDDYKDNARKLKIMGHPIRLQILDMLRLGETCVCHIEAALDKRQAYISQQLMALRDANIVDSRKDGQQVYYRIVDDAVYDVLNVLYGAPPQDELTQFEGCKCPSCATVSIAIDDITLEKG